MKIRTIALSIIAFAVIALMAACTSSKERGDGPNPEPDPGKEEGDGTEVMVNVAVRLPTHAKPKAPTSYAIGKEEEDCVKSIEVLLFSADGYTGKPYYCSLISNDGEEGVTNKKKFTIALPIGGPYTVVILANSKDAVDLVLKGKPALKNSPKSDILALLEKEQTGKWNTTSDTNFDPIPMWGEIADVSVKKNISLNSRLTRMVSKIDVELEASVGSLFELKKVHLYNRYTKGMIAPYELSWDGAKASDPSIPAGAVASKGPQEYEVTDKKSLKGEIYAFEAPAQADDQKSTCLVLEGIYDGKTTFYRVDFANKTDGVVELLSLLRNHSYIIAITAIKGLGAGSADEAFEEGTGNAGGLDYEIMVVDDSDITTVIYNGKYMLGFSQDEFTLSYLERTAADTDNILKIMSNVPSGWKNYEVSYDVVGGEDWLSVNQKEGDGDGNKSDVSLLMTQNMGDVDRVGYLHFSAGSLRHTVKVTQERLIARLSIDKALFNDIEGFGIGTDKHYSYKIDSVFNISSNTDWKIVSSDPGVLSVDKPSGRGDSEIYVVLQPSALYAPKDDYTLTITGIGITTPVVITVKQFGLDIYADNDRGTASRAMPDANFVAACKAHDVVFDGGDGMLSISEAVTFDGQLGVWEKSISSLKGVEYFRSMQYLRCDNNQISELDVTKNVKLTMLWCDDNQLTTLDVTKNMDLTLLKCGTNQISELDVANHTKLETLDCGYNKLTELGVSNLTKLKDLRCEGNQISVLDVTRLSDLTSLWTSRNPLISFDISNNLKLENLYCSSNNLSANISVLDISKHTELVAFDCSNNQLSEQDVTKNVKLRVLVCSNNQLTELDVTKNVNLRVLGCNNNRLTALDVTKNVNLTILLCESNQLTDLDVTNNVNLTALICSSNLLLDLDLTGITKLTELQCNNNQLSALDVTKNAALERLQCNNNQLLELSLTGITKLTELQCNNNQLSTIDVTNNVNLTSLWCAHNPSLTTLDLSRNKVLGFVSAIPSNITTVYVWWPGGGAAGKPIGWSFPGHFDNYVYKP